MISENRVGTYDSRQLEERINNGEYREIAISLHHFYCKNVLEIDPEGCYKYLYLLDDGRLLGYFEKRDKDCIGSIEVEELRIITRVSDVEIQQDYLLHGHKVKYDKPLVNETPDSDLSDIITGKKERTLEIAKGF